MNYEMTKEQCQTELAKLYNLLSKTRSALDQALIKVKIRKFADLMANL